MCLRRTEEMRENDYESWTHVVTCDLSRVAKPFPLTFLPSLKFPLLPNGPHRRTLITNPPLRFLIPPHLRIVVGAVICPVNIANRVITANTMVV